MLEKSLPNYQALSQLSESEISSKGERLVYYDELVVDISKFSHPGSDSLLNSWLGSDVEKMFDNNLHSFNAQLLVASMTIGRKVNKRGRGYELFNNVKQNKLSVVHEKLMNEIDLSQSVLKQISEREPEEIEAFVRIPKYFRNPSEIMFKENKWQEFFFLERFWLSTSIFLIILCGMVWYLAVNSAFMNSFQRVGLFGFGVIVWTMLEYYFHRIKLHLPIVKGMLLHSHYLHHAFPNHKDKLALSIVKNMLIELVLFSACFMIGLNPLNVGHFFMGLHFMLTMYDILHYYFHFGPDIRIPVLSNLKRSHLKHHFKDADRGFGVTTTFWDHMFGTSHLL